MRGLNCDGSKASANDEGPYTGDARAESIGCVAVDGRWSYEARSTVFRAAAAAHTQA